MNQTSKVVTSLAASSCVSKEGADAKAENNKHQPDRQRLESTHLESKQRPSMVQVI